MLIFISYARNEKDGSFVDRLEAELQAREFDTWVDRHKLLGGQDWLDVIQQAIDDCQVLLVVLTPDAANSKYVKMEYRYADHQHKLVVPLLREDCPKVPIDLNGRYWIDFQNNRKRQGLKELLSVLSSPGLAPLQPKLVSPPPTPMPTPPALNRLPDSVLVAPQPAPAPPDLDLMTVYNAAKDALDNNQKERALILLEQINDRDPKFQNGIFLLEMEQLRKELLPIRGQRLYERAKQARLAGEWEQEIGALKVIQELEPKATDVKERINVAQTNRQYKKDYEHAQDSVQEGKLLLARDQLKALWKAAPYYGDPARLAARLGLVAPPIYDEAVKTKGYQLLIACGILLLLVILLTGLVVIVTRMQASGVAIICIVALAGILLYIVVIRLVWSKLKRYI